MEKVLPQSAKDLPQTRWIDLTQGWYAGVRYDGFVLFARTNGLNPDDEKATASILQLTPEDFGRMVERLNALLGGGK